MDLSQIPAVPPPPGVTSNFANPQTRVPMIKIAFSTLLALMLLFVLLRLYSKKWISRKLEKSDYACIVATLAATSYTGLGYYALDLQILGRNLWDVPVSFVTNSALQIGAVLIILFGPVIFLAKLSILLLYLRVFFPDRRTIILVYISLTLNAMHSLAIMIGYGIFCVPLPGQSWQTTKCNSTALFGLMMSVGSVCTDIFMICIPIPVVWNLQLSKSRKLGVSAIFATGTFACLASILSVVYRVKLMKSENATWDTAIIFILGYAEINVSIICSCMPSYAIYFHLLTASFQSLKHRLMSDSPKGSLKPSSILRINTFKRIGPKQETGVHSTLGSAVRNEDPLSLEDLTPEV